MRAIDQALVDEVWREMTAYPPDRVQAEAQAFLRRQPHVAAFSHAVTRRFDPRVQQAALGLCFLLFKILERSLGQPFPLVAEDRIVAAYGATTERLEESGRADARAIAGGVAAGAHPSLIAYILSVFYRGDADPVEYDEEIKASLVLLLAALTDALDLGAVEG